MSRPVLEPISTVVDLRRIQPAASSRARLTWIVRSVQRPMEARVRLLIEAQLLDLANRKIEAMVRMSRGLSLGSLSKSWGTAEKNDLRGAVARVESTQLNMGIRPIE